MQVIELLRHTVATLAYRSRKVLAGAPEGFGGFCPAPGCRTPGQILAHMGDLFDWALSLADGKHVWQDSEPLPWDQEADRFYQALAAFDQRLASSVPLQRRPEQIFQGPVADALTHLGQLSMLRRMAGSPVRGENYFRAEIVAARVGRDQAVAKMEFD